MKLQFKKGSTSVSIYIFIQDSSSTTGAGLTGLVFNSAGLVAYYVRPLGSATAITLATLVAETSAYSSGGFKEVSAANMPGIYRLDLPDAVLATGVDSVVVMLKGATNMAQLPLEIGLVAYDPQSASSLGLSNLDATVSSRASQTSVNTIDTNVSAIKTKTDQLVFTIANKVDAAIVNAASFAQAAADLVWGSATRTLTAFSFSVALSAAAVNAIWDQLLTAITTASSIGKLIKDNLDATISSRSSQTSVDTKSSQTSVDAIKAKTDQLVFTTANRVDSTVVDKTGFSLSAAGIDAILDDTPAAELVSVPTTTGTLRAMIQYIFSYLRNKRTVTGSIETLFKEDSIATIGTAAVTDDGSTFTKGKMS